MALDALKSPIAVFDIETIIDTTVIDNLISDDKKAELIEKAREKAKSNGIELTESQLLRQIMEEYHLDITSGNNSFPRQLFHQVVAISCVWAQFSPTDNLFKIRKISSLGDETSSEEEIVSKFMVGFFDKQYPVLVSFNGRTFDMPVLQYRAMKHGISASRFFQSGRYGYSYRYSDDHIDLIDTLSDYGASARIKLNEACSLFGFPGKYGIDGSKVTEKFEAGQIKEIRDYCETDVMNTYLVFLRQALFRGQISKEQYNNSIQEMHNYILNSSNSVWQGFLDQWSIACDEKFFI